MAVTDNYVVQYLLQATSEQEGGHDSGAIWHEKEGGFCTKFRDVEVELDVVASRAGERIYLSLTYAERRMWIAEPPDSGLMAPHYESPDDANLALLLRSLAGAASRQCSAREHQLDAAGAGAREVIVQQLLFGPAQRTGDAEGTEIGVQTRGEVQIR